jgi:hypothetical protein
MDRWPRRHFLNTIGQKHYTRKRGKKMNNSVQEAVDALKSAIDKLANIINKMSKNS